MTGNRCIWCKQVSNHSHIEHVIPEVMGCPSDFVLTSDDVCQSCNNKLGHLDQAVADDFDIISFAAGIPRKKSKPPAIKSRGNVYAFHSLQGSQWYFNMGSNSAAASDGTIVAPFRGGDRNIKARLHRYGPLAEISFETKFGHSKKFRRGLYKIAFSALAHYLGGKELSKEKYDPIRQFVRKGTGDRHFVMLTVQDQLDYHHHFAPPMVSPEGDYALEFRLACVRFIVEFSQSESYIYKIGEKAKQMMGEKGWTLVPRE